jgi:DNA-binding PadR family transcriptional regulator
MYRVRAYAGRMAMFSHGGLRLYLLKLLADGPKHGYELIRLLEQQFEGKYTPSAGTVYPRLARMEVDGLVTHTATAGRKVYAITDAGRAELADRADELDRLETKLDAALAGIGELAQLAGIGKQIEREIRDAIGGTRPGEGRRAFFGFRFGPQTATTPPPAGSTGAEELERRAVQLLEEVRRLARTGRASAEAVRATLVVLDAALDQVRRLLR